jgi:Mg-chelatase subunit ChlD
VYRTPCGASFGAELDRDLEVVRAAASSLPRFAQRQRVAVAQVGFEQRVG